MEKLKLVSSEILEKNEKLGQLNDQIEVKNSTVKNNLNLKFISIKKIDSCKSYCEKKQRSPSLLKPSG